MWCLGARIGGLERERLLAASLKISAAAAVMAVAAVLTERALHLPFDGNDLVARVIRVAGAIGTGIVVLAIAASLLRIEEFEQLKRRFLGAAA
jgi:hypothetical protein